eukprot:GFUD01091869.1.p1 GENE.GFUD01091869.1~~GFUD01091869.1.p1  ORF type:complete len:690 (-),score=109.23 GFUD01091869.1:36-2105(-)
MNSHGVSNPAFQDEELKSEPATLELTESATDGIGLHLRSVDRVDKNNGVDTNDNVDVKLIIDDCSLACLRLKFLNRFRSPKWFLSFLCLAACLQGLCINGLVNVVITSIERRFGLQSTQSGIIASSYDIGSLIIMIPVSYLGGKAGASKPRWIAGGMLVMGLGSLVWTLPHFSTEAYTKHGMAAEEDLALCGSAGEDQDCATEVGEGGLAAYRFVFIFGQLLHGFGAAPLITLGTTFLDESVNPRSSPLYIAIFQTFFLIGPAIGYVIGGQLLSIHTDLVNDSGLTPEASIWVGAWWPGFLITFIMSIVCGFCIFCYPSSINRKKNTCIKPEKSDESPGFVKALPSALWSLLSNPTYMFVSLASGVDGLVISGLAAFLPKFIEQQYQLSNGLAAQIVGLIIVPAGGGGTFFGGWIIKKRNMSRHTIILMCLLSQLLVIPIVLAFLLSCSSPPYVGVNHAHTNTSTTQRSYFPTPTVSSPSPYISSCNAGCSCPLSKFDPVCGSDSLMYLSPCLAGCSASSASNNFTNCACIGEGDGTAERTTCDNGCGHFIPFVVIEFWGIFLTFLATMPAVVASLRCVHQHEKSLGLGLQSIILRLVGSIPGPVMFGYFLDKACILWEPNCDDHGSCLLYNNNQMSTSILGICLLGKGFSVLFYGLGWLASKRSSIQDIVEENTQTENGIPHTTDVKT